MIDLSLIKKYSIKYYNNLIIKVNNARWNRKQGKFQGETSPKGSVTRLTQTP